MATELEGNEGAGVKKTYSSIQKPSSFYSNNVWRVALGNVKSNNAVQWYKEKCIESETSLE